MGMEELSELDAEPTQPCAPRFADALDDEETLERMLAWLRAERQFGFVPEFRVLLSSDGEASTHRYASEVGR